MTQAETIPDEVRELVRGHVTAYKDQRVDERQPLSALIEKIVMADRAARSAQPVVGGEPEVEGLGHMRKISSLIDELTQTRASFGDTCVYIRRGGLSWGGVALNREADDQKNGVFDLQAQHDADMRARLEQIDRLIKDRNEWRAKALLSSTDHTALLREAMTALERVAGDLPPFDADLVEARHVVKSLKAALENTNG